MLELEAGGWGRGPRRALPAQLRVRWRACGRWASSLTCEESQRGYIITSFHYPEHPNFNFQTFYEHLSDKGYIIYPGKLSHADCFRIGHIGRLAAGDVKALMAAIAETLEEMHVDLVKVPVG